MAWSTRELADLSGTTVNTIRHYHRLGLLDEPDRRYNGYKQYGAAHLVRLLRIRRLVDLGVPLARIGEMASGGENAPESLRTLDAELAAKIERLQHARADIAATIEGSAPADSPPGFERVARTLSDADSSLVHIYTRLYDDEALADVRAMIEADASDDGVSREVDALAADADEQTRQDLAERLAPSIARDLAAYPWLSTPGAHLSRSERVAQETVLEAFVELHNPAQLDVLGRASLIALASREPASAEAGDTDADTTSPRPPDHGT